MASITTINGSDVISTSRTVINTNFSNLNTDKIETSTLDTDTTLAANSDSKIATQKATKAYVDASVNPTGRSWNEYAVDSVGSDSYAITVSGISAYVAGQTFKFKAGTANTGACTLNVNGLGAKTIKKDVSSDLVTGDILVNQILVVTYDGTNMVMNSRLSGTVTSNPSGVISSSLIPGLSVSSGATTKDCSATTTTTIAHGLGSAPSLVQIDAKGTTSASFYVASTVYSASTQSSSYLSTDTGSGTGEIAAATFTMKDSTGSGGITGTITVDATNISIAWSGTTFTSTAYLTWIAYK